MKPLPIVLAIVGLLVAIALPWPDLGARSFPTAQSADTLNITLLSTTTSNVTGSAYFVESASVHTFQIVTLCTNACSNIISGSLDGTSWFMIATNSQSASATNGIVFIGYRLGYLRATFGQTTASGSTNTILYLGGRQ